MPVAKETSRRRRKIRRQIPASLTPRVTARAESQGGLSRYRAQRSTRSKDEYLPPPTLSSLQAHRPGALFRVVSRTQVIIIIGHYCGFNSVVQKPLPPIQDMQLSP